MSNGQVDDLEARRRAIGQAADRLIATIEKDIQRQTRYHEMERLAWLLLGIAIGAFGTAIVMAWG